MIGRREHPVGEPMVTLLGRELAGLLGDLAGLEGEDRLADHGMTRASVGVGVGRTGIGGQEVGQLLRGQRLGPSAAEHEVARLDGGLVLVMEQAELAAQGRLHGALVDHLAVQREGDLVAVQGHLDRVPLRPA